jgi:hypothetical protein
VCMARKPAVDACTGVRTGRPGYCGDPIRTARRGSLRRKRGRRPGDLDHLCCGGDELTIFSQVVLPRVESKTERETKQEELTQRLPQRPRTFGGTLRYEHVDSRKMRQAWMATSTRPICKCRGTSRIFRLVSSPTDVRRSRVSAYWLHVSPNFLSERS